MLMPGCSSTAPEIKVKYLCPSTKVWFLDADEIKATPMSIKRQVRVANGQIEECWRLRDEVKK